MKSTSKPPASPRRTLVASALAQLSLASALLPWGNLAFFHPGYRYSPGLIRLGRVDAGVEPLLTRGTFPLRLSAATGRGR